MIKYKYKSEEIIKNHYKQKHGYVVLVVELMEMFGFVRELKFCVSYLNQSNEILFDLVDLSLQRVDMNNLNLNVRHTYTLDEYSVFSDNDKFVNKMINRSIIINEMRNNLTKIEDIDII